MYGLGRLIHHWCDATDLKIEFKSINKKKRFPMLTEDQKRELSFLYDKLGDLGIDDTPDTKYYYYVFGKAVTLITEQ